MLLLKLWRTSSTNTSFLIEHSLICGAEKDWDESDKVRDC